MCCEPVLEDATPFTQSGSYEIEHLDLLAEPQSARRGRAFVRAHAPDWAPDARMTLELLTSELVTNGILHARTQMSLGVAVSEHGEVFVAVGDQNLAMPEQQPYSDSRATGRGLTLVEGLADEWGVRTHEDGKTMWFVLRGSAAAADGRGR